mmetsp:Transcript_5528/g.13562  ORF Transcript_5528/g.13562 Transcript_5528/m.13562 type:complete len:99 (-) Transcript_5528:1767-2063(-)
MLLRTKGRCFFALHTLAIEHASPESDFAGMAGNVLTSSDKTYPICTEKNTRSECRVCSHFQGRRGSRRKLQIRHRLLKRLRDRSSANLPATKRTASLI